MEKLANIHSTIDPKVKEGIKPILSDLGLTMSDAIRMFLNQVYLTKSIPFPIRIPNAETRQVIKNTDDGIGVKKFDNHEDMMSYLKA